jgi:hypothetical protein
MISASFLTKHLVVDYRRGEAHYMKFLTDGDWAQNNFNWQWCALQPMSAFGVRRDKAALSSGCKSHPANAPAGSSRSSYGGDEIAEAFGMRVTNW